jgi:uncharacterized protein (DUF1499 family)
MLTEDKKPTFDVVEFSHIVHGFDKLYLMIDEESNILLSRKGRIALFTKDSLLPECVARKIDNKPVLRIDCEEVFRKIQKNKIDQTACIINYINLLTDILESQKKELPEEFKSKIYKLADRLTFYREFNSVLLEHKISRSFLANYFYWMQGFLMAHSEII